MRLAILFVLFTLVASGYARFFFYRRRPSYRRFVFPSYYNSGYNSYGGYGGSRDYGDRNERWTDA